MFSHLNSTRKCQDESHILAFSCLTPCVITYVWDAALWFHATECSRCWEIFWSTSQSCYLRALERQEPLQGRLSRNLHGESPTLLLSTSQYIYLQNSHSLTLLCILPSESELSTIPTDCCLISLLISRGAVHHCIIRKLLASYWSCIAIVLFSSWSPVCGLHRLLSSASSSSACPSFASPAFCSIISTETT